MPLEIALHPADLKIQGHCRILEGASTHGDIEIPDLEPGQVAPTNRLIQTDQSFIVQFKWHEYGKFVRFLGGGSWHCQVIFEQMGGGETSFEPFTTIPDQGVPDTWYTANVEIRPNQVEAGLYRVICCVQYVFGPCSGQPNVKGPIVMFEDLGIVKVYEEH